MKIRAHSERYRNLLAGIFEIRTFFWQHRVSIVTGLAFYRLRLVRNLNSREFIVCSGKVVSVYLLTDRITYSSHSSPVDPMHFRYGTPCFSLKEENYWWDMTRKRTVK